MASLTETGFVGRILGWRTDGRELGTPNPSQRHTIQCHLTLSTVTPLLISHLSLDLLSIPGEQSWVRTSDWLSLGSLSPPFCRRKALCPTKVGNYLQKGKNIKRQMCATNHSWFYLFCVCFLGHLFILGQTIQSPSDTSKINIYIIPFAEKRKPFSVLLWNPLQDWPQGERGWGRELSEVKELILGN